MGKFFKSPDGLSFLIITFLNLYFLSGSGNSLSANDRVIYGTDDRQLISNTSDPRYKDWSSATANLVNNMAIRPAFGGFLTAIDSMKLKDSPQYDACEGESFEEQPLGGHCTGFLIAEDVLVTAGHCVFTEFDCLNSSWVFDFRTDLVIEGEDLYVDSDLVVGCKEVIKQVFDWENEIDYAVIRLDKKMTDRNPLKVRRSGKVSDSSELAMVGHPLGLPSVITDNAKIRDNSSELHFISNLDSFKGNSGAPILNTLTGDVEGILISGEDDWELDEQNKCFRAKQCADDECDGEKALRITELEETLATILP